MHVKSSSYHFKKHYFETHTEIIWNHRVPCRKFDFTMFLAVMCRFHICFMRNLCVCLDPQYFLSLIRWLSLCSQSWPRTRALGSATARLARLPRDDVFQKCVQNVQKCSIRQSVSNFLNCLNFCQFRTKGKIKLCDIETHHRCNAKVLKMPIFEAARDAAASAYTRFAVFWCVIINNLFQILWVHAEDNQDVIYSHNF